VNDPFPTEAVRVALRAVIRWAMQPDPAGEAVGGRVIITPRESSSDTETLEQKGETNG
jgi:hypothetical protein